MKPADTNRHLELRPEELQMVREILQRHVPGRTVWAFGSRVQGRARRFSDLDLAVLGEQPLAAATQADLAEDFTESDLPFKVDIVDWATTPERFRQIVRGQYVELQAGADKEESK